MHLHTIKAPQTPATNIMKRKKSTKSAFCIMWDLKSLEQKSGGSYNWIPKLSIDLMNNDLCAF